MTFATEQVRAGREPVTVVELDLDTCSLTFSVGACTATGASGTECYNTRQTCQDPENYARTTKIYRFVEPVEGLPIGEDMIPCLTGAPRLAPTKITEEYGLGHRASVTVNLQDFTHHDRGIDPYVATRSYTPEEQGTFFGKLRARTPYYQGRIMRVRVGYLTDPFNWNNFEDREYVIEEIRGPSLDGKVQIIGKDILKLADDSRSKCPVASTGELLTDIDNSQTTMSVEGGTYNDPAVTLVQEWVRVGDEIIEYTGIAGSGTVADPWVLSGLDRNDLAWGSQADEHEAEDIVQQCKAWQGENVRDILDELLVTSAGISSSYIDATQWDQEESRWLTSYSLTTIISEPEGVAGLISELQEQCRVRIWWDEINQTIPLRSVGPPFLNTRTTLTDTENFTAGSMSVKDKSRERVSQVYFYYGVKDFTSTDVGNYRRLYVQIDTDAETAEQFAD